MRLADDGSSGTRTQGGCNGSAIAPTEDAESAQIRRRQGRAGGFETASQGVVLGDTVTVCGLAAVVTVLVCVWVTVLVSVRTVTTVLAG